MTVLANLAMVGLPVNRTWTIGQDGNRPRHRGIPGPDRV